MESYKLMKFQSYEIATKQSKASKNITFAYCMAIVVTTILGLLYMALITKVYEQNYTLQVLGDKISDIERQNQKLEIEVEKLRSLNRIEKIAINEIGMQLPEKIIYFYIDNEEGTQVPLWDKGRINL